MPPLIAYELPFSKERWTAAAAAGQGQKYGVMGQAMSAQTIAPCVVGAAMGQGDDEAYHENPQPSAGRHAFRRDATNRRARSRRIEISKRSRAQSPARLAATWLCRPWLQSPTECSRSSPKIRQIRTVGDRAARSDDTAQPGTSAGCSRANARFAPPQTNMDVAHDVSL